MESSLRIDALIDSKIDLAKNSYKTYLRLHIKKYYLIYKYNGTIPCYSFSERVCSVCGEKHLPHENCYRNTIIKIVKELLHDIQ